MSDGLEAEDGDDLEALVQYLMRRRERRTAEQLAEGMSLLLKDPPTNIDPSLERMVTSVSDFAVGDCYYVGDWPIMLLAVVSEQDGDEDENGKGVYCFIGIECHAELGSLYLDIEESDLIMHVEAGLFLHDELFVTKEDAYDILLTQALDFDTTNARRNEPLEVRSVRRVFKAIRAGDLEDIRFLVQQTDEESAAEFGEALNDIVEDRFTVDGKEEDEDNADVKDYPGITAVNLAILEIESPSDRLEAVRLLLGAGANPNVQVRQTGKTPLHLAVDVDDTALLRLLVAHEYIDLNVQDLSASEYRDRDRWIKRCSDGTFTDVTVANDTPLHAALRAENEAAASLFLAGGANPSIPNAIGETAFHFALEEELYGMAETMLKTGLVDCSLGSEDMQGSPLHYYASRSDLQAFGLLLAHCNAELVNAPMPGSTGFTPLHLAARTGRLQNCALLIGRGADVSVRDARGKTPAELATLNKKTEVAEYLVSAAATTSARKRVKVAS